MSIFSNLEGLIGGILQLGRTGPKVKADTGVVQARNAADNAYAKMQIADPTVFEDAVTLKYFDKNQYAVIVVGEADCSSALPTNTGTKRILAVSVAGNGAVLGDLLFDLGTSSGNMEIIPAKVGRGILVTTACTTLVLKANVLYIWNSGWVATSEAVNAVKVEAITCTTTTPVDSATTLGASDQILRIMVDITTAYSAGATITVQNKEDSAVFINAEPLTTEDTLIFEFNPTNGAWTTASKIRVAIGGTPEAGACDVRVEYY